MENREIHERCVTPNIKSDIFATDEGGRDSRELEKQRKGSLE